MGDTLSLTGGNGETLADYIDGISEITVAYTDENGETVSTLYNTQWQHDVEPDYTGSDFFDEDGSLNLDIAPFVYGADGDYTITISSAGFDDITAAVGASYVLPTETSEETESTDSTGDTSDNTGSTDSTDTSDDASDSTDDTDTSDDTSDTTSDDSSDSSSSSSTSSTETGDASPIAVWSIALIAAAGALTKLFLRRRA